MIARSPTARLALGVVVALAALPASACETGDTEPDISALGERGSQFPDVVAAEATRAADGTWSFLVTVSSPYDSPARYADGWKIVGLDGTVYGEQTLTHDHASEQPFVRRQSGVVIPDDVDEVTVVGRDSANGYGGDTLTIPLESD